MTKDTHRAPDDATSPADPPEAGGAGEKKKHRPIGLWIRRNFLTGLVIAAPITLTVYVTIAFVDFVDNNVRPLIPKQYNPETFLGLTIPGLGVVIAFISLTLLGALTANLFGRTIIQTGERLVDRMPVVRSIYTALKQIFETAVAQSETSFQKVALIEYPRPGVYAIGFVTTETKGEVRSRIGEDLLSVFVPTTPNPTSGFLLFFPRKDVQILDMSVEEAAKIVISAGLVEPKHLPKGKKPQDLADIAPPLPRPQAPRDAAE